jgi:hypothetical protein
MRNLQKRARALKRFVQPITCAIAARGIRGVASVSELIELVREAVLVETSAPSSTQGGLAYDQCASEGFPCAYFPRSDVTSAFVFLLRNGMADAGMIGVDSVVNSRDLHTAIAQSATLRIAIGLHERMSPAQVEQAAGRSCSWFFKWPRAEPDRWQTNSVSTRYDMLSDWPSVPSAQ